MNTLTVSQIISRLPAFQEQYLSILNQPEQYYTPVENAFVHIWPAAKQPLYLGDLLQLWFGGKWLINNQQAPLINTVLREKSKADPQFDQYVYSLTGNLLSGENTACAWTQSAEQQAVFSAGALLQFYCVWKSLNRPKTPIKYAQHA